MQCPFCGKQMQSGVIRYDSRSGLRWSAGAEKICGWDKFWNSLGGIGQLTAAQENGWTVGKVPGEYCPSCKKMIIETDIKR